MSTKIQHTIDILTAALNMNLRLIRQHKHDRRKYAAELVGFYRGAQNCRTAIKQLTTQQK